ncbi:MAG: molybdate ABC transporter substrate-binding protein [Pseudomonadales bacterium]|nr:molybdate ABC transporter substrate-binding protein [Pseudomonadales bacterium]
MSRRWTQILCCVGVAFACLLSTPSIATTVFAAASLKEAFEEIATDFSAATGAELTLSFASSSILARQIEFGAPADVFVSANVAWMDWLEDRGHIQSKTRTDLIGNRLVMVAHRADTGLISLSDAPAIETLLGDGRLAMGLVAAVPAGIYGKAALAKLGVWRELEDQVAQTDNVRAAVMLVATGEAPLGIVYASDVVASEVHVVGTFPAESHAPIVYPVAATKATEDPVVGQLLSFLNTEAARDIFVRHGFTPLQH